MPLLTELNGFAGGIVPGPLGAAIESPEAVQKAWDQERAQHRRNGQDARDTATGVRKSSHTRQRWGFLCSGENHRWTQILTEDFWPSLSVGNNWREEAQVLFGGADALATGVVEVQRCHGSPTNAREPLDAAPNQAKVIWPRFDAPDETMAPGHRSGDQSRKFGRLYGDCSSGTPEPGWTVRWCRPHIAE